MNIKPKFNIGDLTQRRYEKQKDTFCCLQIKEIITQTCHADTQIWYLCLPIIGRKRPDRDNFKTNDFYWEISSIMSKETDNLLNWHKVREDDLTLLPSEYTKAITSKDIVIIKGKE